MEFRVVARLSEVDQGSHDVVFLWNTGWDDWFEFETLHRVVYVDNDGHPHEIGDIKIGETGLQGGQAGATAPGVRKPDLPERFDQIPEQFFSLGQDASYYEDLGTIGANFREQILRRLRDIAFDENARRTAMPEKVTGVSLLRSVTLKTVEDQFARMAHGGARLTSFSFTFRPLSEDPRPRLKFSVEPGSRPPSNVHVIIGRNGVGKSTLLNKLAHRMVEGSRDESAGAGPWDQLSNIVSVSFSAFDEFKPMKQTRERSSRLTYHYVGLKKVSPREGEAGTKDDPAIKGEMTRSLKLCLVGARRSRLRKALDLLESDPIFAEAGLAELLELPESTEEEDDDTTLEQAVAEFGSRFRRLSSGHKIVLLSISKLVETVEEKSLVLLDEPEAHLHPPLLSAFIRALSDLLTNRNGMAVIATHSPVVLQEVPRSCVWKLGRSGNNLRVERPRLETFGENVGVLTDEVFGLEVTSTGFHRMLADAAMAAETYEEALSSFDGQLGSEGRSILRAMMIGSSTVTRSGPHHVGS